MEINRRDFIVKAAQLSGLALVSPLLGASRVAAGGDHELGMLIDVSKCVGCMWCYAACKHCNGLPETTQPDATDPPPLASDTWSSLYAVCKDDGWHFRKNACLHCIDAACVEVCPTGALKYHELGFVEYHREVCSGCGYCADVCPFGAPHLEKNTASGLGIMDKCTFCMGRVVEGLEPACAEACPHDAIIFGERAALIELGRQRVTELVAKNPEARLYGDTENGGLHVMFVLDHPPEDYGLPADPQIPAQVAIEKVLSSLGVAAFGVALLGFGVNYGIAKKRLNKGE